LLTFASQDRQRNRCIIIAWRRREDGYPLTQTWGSAKLYMDKVSFMFKFTIFRIFSKLHQFWLIKWQSKSRV
jgi:hypothetical protein